MAGTNMQNNLIMPRKLGVVGKRKEFLSAGLPLHPANEHIH
jgi:hypothetical protein